MNKNHNLSEDFLYVYHIAKVDNILGPGKRLVIWTAGCFFNCIDCIALELHSFQDGKRISVSEILHIVNNNLTSIDGITFSGGEPLSQPNALYSIMTNINIHSVLFTGYIYKNLSDSLKKVADNFDLIIDGPFIKNLQGDFLWRGSSNQNYISPTAKHNQTQLKSFYNSKNNGISLNVNNDKIFFYGVPLKNQLNFLKNKLKEYDFEI